MLVGAPTEDGATFACKVDGGGPVRVAVALDEAMTAPVFTASAAVDAQGVAKVLITGLTPATRHFWQVEDNGTLDTDPTGQFLTLPPLGVPATFTIGISSCAGLDPDFPGEAGGELDPGKVSNHPIYDTIRERALAEGWLMFVNEGDWGYPNFGDDTTDTLANRRAYYDDNLAQPRQAALWRSLSSWYLYDDHDFLANNQRGASPNAVQAYAERVSHYTLVDPNGAIYAAKQVGRVLLMGADVRYYGSANGDPDGPSKTMLGAGQKAWMQSLLSTLDVKFLIWLMPQQWLGTAADSWASFATEQTEVVGIFDETGFLGRMCIASGDYHGLGLDTGATSPGNIPVLQAGSLDSTPGSGSGGTYDLGTLDGRGQYGTITVADLGSHLVVTLTAWRGTSAVFQHRFTVAGDPPPALGSGALASALTGSHQLLVSTRVVTTFQTGDDPDGTPIEVIDGDVRYDGTARIRGTANVDVVGFSQTTWRSLWPRRAVDLFTPYGNELFVEVGVDFGGAGPLMVPMGYFRITTPRQAVAPYGTIRLLSCQDRMAGIVEGEFLEPRELRGTRTIGSVVEELITEIYPDAVIIFDDNTSMQPLGRTVVLERSRYQGLLDIATAAGKIIYWDNQGAFRFETAPDPSAPTWRVAAGKGGTQVEVSRELTRIGRPNAIVAIGEGSDGVPVRAVAIDANPLSPTYFGGRYGKVPERFATPLLHEAEQAATAAAQLLRRRIGLAYSIQYSAVPDPARRPYDPGEVTYQDGNAELHILQAVTIPFRGRPMTGTTREQTLLKVEV
jgi:hypothetical protein